MSGDALYLQLVRIILPALFFVHLVGVGLVVCYYKRAECYFLSPLYLCSRIRQGHICSRFLKSWWRVSPLMFLLGVTLVLLNAMSSSIYIECGADPLISTTIAPQNPKGEGTYQLLWVLLSCAVITMAGFVSVLLQNTVAKHQQQRLCRCNLPADDCVQFTTMCRLINHALNTPLVTPLSVWQNKVFKRNWKSKTLRALLFWPLLVLFALIACAPSFGYVLAISDDATLASPTLIVECRCACWI